MTTIKSYSDLQQSKKLAEILPIGSADMHWAKDFDGSWFVDLAEYTSVKIPKYVGNVEEHLLPCWSLASLLELLPKRLEIADNVYELSVYFYGLYYWNIVNGNLCFESKDKDNLVDACVEMILKLHELKLL